MSASTSSAGRVSAPSPVEDPPRSFTTTLAPCAASSNAPPRPTPGPAPLTIAILPSVIATAGLLAIGTTAAIAAPLAYTTVFDDGGCRIVTVDIATGTTTALSAAPDEEACVSDLAVGPDGRLWGILQLQNGIDLDARLVEFDPATGAILGEGPITGNFTESGLAEGGIAFNSNDVMVVHIVTDEPGCDESYVCLYTVDPATRVATFVGNSGQFETEMFFLTADC